MRIENLILIRLATAKKVGPGELAKQLHPLVGSADVRAHIRTLVAGGWAAERPLRITDKGRARAAKALGVDAIPRWRTVKSRMLPALVLGVSMTGKKTTLQEAVVAHLLMKLVGLTPASDKPKDITAQAVKKALQVSRADAATLQAAVVRQWIAEEPAPVAAPKEWNDDDVLEAVRRATPRVSQAGRFGDDRVFVSALWRQLGEGSGFPGLTLDGFKTRLVKANQRQQLTLVRADLVGAMDPREVAASEIRYLNSTFHFVLDRSRS